MLWPSGFHPLAALLLLCAFGSVLVDGDCWAPLVRFACPQTVYTEIFWLEHWIEGDRPKRIKLDEAPSRTANCVSKPQTMCFGSSCHSGLVFTFVGFSVQLTNSGSACRTSASGHGKRSGIFFMASPLTATPDSCVNRYACTCARMPASKRHVRPDTLVIFMTPNAANREAPAGKEPINAQGLGDCVDCGICAGLPNQASTYVTDCNTECIGCAACIDACDR